jgi:hypothetical protein
MFKIKGNNMLKTKGVYTVSCPECQSTTLIHLLDSDGSINPHKCSGCEIEFKGIENGEQRHSFIGIVGEGSKRSSENDESKKTGKKSSKKKKKKTKKDDSKPSEMEEVIEEDDSKPSETEEKTEKTEKTDKKIFKW